MGGGGGVWGGGGGGRGAARQPPGSRGEWISAALADDDHREQVVLAAGLSADVASELIETARQAADPASRSRGLLWAADATADGARPAAEAPPPSSMRSPRPPQTLRPPEPSGLAT